MAHRSAFALAVSGDRPLFLPGRGAGRGHRSLPQVCPFYQPGGVPAVPDRTFAPLMWVWMWPGEHSCRAGVRKRQAAAYCGFLLLPGRGAKRGHRLSPAAFLSCRTGAVPAIPDWASALQTQAWQAAEAYSCHAVAYQREAGEYCGSPFLLGRAEGQKHQYRTPWRPGVFLWYQGVERDLHPSSKGYFYRKSAVVPAVPDRASVLPMWVWMWPGEHSCCAGVQKQRVGENCGPLFLLDHAENQKRQDWIFW